MPRMLAVNVKGKKVLVAPKKVLVAHIGGTQMRKKKTKKTYGKPIAKHVGHRYLSLLKRVMGLELNTILALDAELQRI